MGKGPKPAPRWIGNILATVLERVGPRGLEFGRYSIEYHYIRNWLHVQVRPLPGQVYLGVCVRCCTQFEVRPASCPWPHKHFPDAILSLSKPALELSLVLGAAS